MVGFRYANRYQATDVIGQDAISVVRRGRDLLMDRDVAIKVLRADMSAEPAVQTSFRQVAHHAAALNHPAFVAVYDTGDTPTDSGSVPYVVMEYVEGESLRALLHRQGPLPWRRALRIAAELCSAIDHAHRRNLVPCHITPANVLIDPQAGGREGDRVKVIDIGQRQPGAAQVVAMQYVSPEGIRGGLPDKRSDLYTVGCVMYEMLCGRAPFIGVTADTIADGHLREAPRAPSELNRTVPRDVDAIVLTALSKNPENRYANAEQLRADIERALAGRAVHARRQFEPSAAAPRRGPATAPSAVPAPAPASRAAPKPNAPLLAPGLTLPVLDEVEGIDPEREAAQRRRWTYVALGGLAVALVVALWLTLVVITTPPPPAKVAVPSVLGMTVSEANTVLADKDLRLGAVTTVDTDKGPTGTIVNQRPSERTEVEMGTDVAVEVEG